jgi:hypothetical protein
VAGLSQSVQSDQESDFKLGECSETCAARNQGDRNPAPSTRTAHAGLLGQPVTESKISPFERDSETLSATTHCLRRPFSRRG